MKTELQVDITYDQILSLVRQLSNDEKIQLAGELEREGIEVRLSKILSAFRTDELSLETIDEEVEAVRQRLYDKQSS